jgi:hypothetical protein
MGKNYARPSRKCAEFFNDRLRKRERKRENEEVEK